MTTPGMYYWNLTQMMIILVKLQKIISDKFHYYNILNNNCYYSQINYLTSLYHILIYKNASHFNC